MSLFKSSVEFFGKKISLGIVFEVVDDPDDKSRYRGLNKAIDVHFVILTALPEDKDFSLLRSFTSTRTKPKLNLITSITPSTPRELREFTLNTFDESGYLFVVAVPSPPWDKYYNAREYDPLYVDVGKKYNFSISTPSKPEKSTG